MASRSAKFEFCKERKVIDDLDIINSINLGDKAAFEKLVIKYQSKLRGFCASMLQDKSLGDDAAQDVFVKAFRNIKKFRADSSFASWLFKIARNHCLDLIRKKRRRPEESLDNVLLSLNINASNADLVENNQFIKVVLNSISENYKEVIILREMYGMSYEEISKIIDCSIDAVKARLKRARKELSANLRHFLTESSSK